MSSKEVDSPDYLYRLCWNNNWDKVRKYLDRSDLSTDVKKKQIHWKNSNRYTTFSLACFEKGPIDIIKSMIDIAGDEIVHVARIRNCTPLHHACYDGVDVGIMNLLVQTGKKKLIMEKSSIHATALHAACTNNVINVGDIKPMVDIGGKELVLEAGDEWKYTCLHNACVNKPTPDALKLLLDVGGKDLLMSRDKNGSTPFHIALKKPNNHGPQGLQVFVDAGDMELFFAKNNQDQTPISLIKDLKSNEEFTSQEWKNFFHFFDEKLSKEGVMMAKMGTEVEDEKTLESLQNDVSTLESNNKMLEDKKKADAKAIESLETRLKKLEKEGEKHKNAIQVFQKENGKSKETIQSLQAEKENDAKIIQALQTEKEEFCIQKQGIMKELEAKIVSEHEKDKTIQSLREENTFLQEEGASKMKVMKRKIEKPETVSKEESHGDKKKRSRLFFW